MSEAVAGRQAATAAATTAGSVRIGSVLGGKYRLTRHLGDGAMGTVFAAQHERLGREVAIKILRADLCSHTESAARFQREAELVTRIGHPNIVAVYDFGRADDGGLYYVMELISGRTLRARLDEGPLTDDELVTVFAPLLSALEAAHGVGVVHRDLKPENVMLLETAGNPVPQLKLLDFGVAKIREDKDGAVVTTIPDSEGSLATKSGALMGTPAYMAPEQAHDPTSVDLRADVYAVGILLFEALCGQRPFSGSTVGELIGAHMYQPAEKPSLLHTRKGLPARSLSWKQLDAVVDKALAKKASERFATCAGLRKELVLAWRSDALWAAASQGYANQPSVGFAGAAGRPARQLGLYLGALAGLLVAGGGALWLVERQHRRAQLLAEAADRTPRGRATAKLHAALTGGVAERRALVAAVELVHSRTLLPYVEAALRDQAAAVWPAAVPVAAAIGEASDAALRELLSQRATQANSTVAVEIAAAQLRLGVSAAVPVLKAAAASNAAVPRLRATLALSAADQASAAELKRALTQSESKGAVPPALRQAVLVQLVKLGETQTDKQLEQALQQSPPAGAAEDALEAADESLAVYVRAGRSAFAPQLLKMAQSATVPRKLALAVALAEAADARAMPLLLPLLADATPRVRQRAAGAVGSLGAAASSGAPVLTRLLDDPDPGVALTASAALLAVSPLPSLPAGASAADLGTTRNGAYAHG